MTSARRLHCSSEVNVALSITSKHGVDAMREIGRIYAALTFEHDDEMPDYEGNDAQFESIPVTAAAWRAFENSPLCEGLYDIDHGGLIGCYEEFWFKAPQLPGLIELIESGIEAAPTAARAFVVELAKFARRAYARGVGITFVIGG
jgi:hypothetical protein